MLHTADLGVCECVCVECLEPNEARTASFCDPCQGYLAWYHGATSADCACLFALCDVCMAGALQQCRLGLQYVVGGRGGGIPYVLRYRSTIFTGQDSEHSVCTGKQDVD